MHLVSAEIVRLRVASIRLWDSKEALFSISPSRLGSGHALEGR